MFKLISKNGLYGIENGEEIAVPILYKTGLLAIKELEYFLKENNKRSFLEFAYSDIQIAKITDKLKRQL